LSSAVGVVVFSGLVVGLGFVVPVAPEVVAEPVLVAPESEVPGLVVPEAVLVPAVVPAPDVAPLVAADDESPVAAELADDASSPAAAVTFGLAAAGALNGLRRRPGRSRTIGTLVSTVISAFSGAPVPEPVAGVAGSAAVEAGSSPPRPRTTAPRQARRPAVARPARGGARRGRRRRCGRG
jgi:hypothetical protein